MPSFVNRIFKTLREAGARFLSGAQKEFNIQVKVGKFDLDAQIQNSEFNNGLKGTKAAADWIKKQIKTGEYKYYNGVAESGKLYLFRYSNPKHKATLEWFDANPLVLVIGHYTSSNNELIEMGINLHHLPLKVRRQVIVKVFEMYANRYKGEMYRATQKEINLQWKAIAIPLLPYGASFAFRSYINTRRAECIEFKYEDWDKAIYIPSMKYVGIDQTKLAAEWKVFVTTKAFTQLSSSRLEDILGSY